MKFSRNVKLIFRLIVLPGILLLALWFSINALGRLFNSGNESEKLPVIRSFGILIPSGYSVHGIDVSKHQGHIDWKRVANMQSNNIKISFAFIKATEGITRQDQKFDYNWQQASKNKIIRGAYHFYYPSRDAEKQAANFIRKVKLYEGDLPPVVDIEMSNGKSADIVRQGLQTMLDRLEKEYKMKPVIYTNINFYNTFLKDKFEKYPLWIAGYFDHDRFYNTFETPWQFWQHSEKGRVDGIKNHVDFNVFKGDIKKLTKLCK
jgi:lysozyme